MSPPPHPFSQQQTAALLAGLTDDFVFLETGKISDDNQTSLLFQRPVGRLQCVDGISPREFLQNCQAMLDRGFYLAGWFSYEFGLGLEPRLATLLPPPATLLADLGVFHAPAAYDHCQGRWNQDDLPTAAATPAVCRVTNIRPNLSQQDYEHCIARIKAYITAGDTYQVNYTLKLLFDLHGDADELFLQLRRNQMVSYSAYISHGRQRIMSFSPELFFRKKGGVCTVRPMKGTSRRGRTLDEDRQRAAALQNDEKNRAENVMIVDLLRNDLGRLARPGSVTVSSLFDVETYESLLQMTSTISAEIPANLDLATLFSALFPCGSVTGAPKIRTMEIIHELEPCPRGIYTGAIGYLSPNGDALFNVPIRTVVLDGERGEMGIGSGIVADSLAEKEWRECLLKADFLSKPRPDFQLIETMVWTPGQGYWLLDRHLARLAASARYFGYGFEEASVTAALGRLQATLGPEYARVRLLLDRQGRITLSHAPCPAPTTTGLPAAAPLAQDLPKTRLAPVRTDTSDIFLYHKTTQRQVYDRLWQEAQDQGYLDLIFTNERGEVSEGAITSIFLEREGILYTPPLSAGLLPGVFRGYLLESYPERVREKSLVAAELTAPGATLYLANSVRGLVRVKLVHPA
jgi:para-aminobenzoate synthetase/4-amino-4-deoxychorismate lyase